MALSPTSVAPPPPPPAPVPREPAGTRDDPYVYSDGTPIVYNDGETEEQYRARVQAMVDAANAPSSAPGDGVVGQDNTATQLAAANGQTIQAAPQATDDVSGVAGDGVGVGAAPVPSTAAPQPSAIPSTLAEAQPGGMAQSAGADVLAEDGVTTPTPSGFKTMDEYLAAQAAVANAVTAAHAQPAPEPELTDEQKIEQDYVDSLDIDGRLRRVEAQLGLRSPTLVA